MEMKEYLKTGLAISLMLVSSLFVGSMLGWVTNPNHAKAIKFAHSKIVELKITGTNEEISNKMAEFAREYESFYIAEPSESIAILMSNPFLLFAFGFMWLVVFRPKTKNLFVGFGLVSAVCLIAVNLSAALSCALGAVLFCALRLLIIKLRGQNAT